MRIFKKIVFVVYKEYRNWEDDDSNGTEIINVFSKEQKAIKNIFDEYNNELQFFIENGTEILDKNCSNAGYYIETPIGNVEGYLVKQEVF